MSIEKNKYLYKKVLVIDDNPTDRYVASYMIEKSFLSEEVIVMELATIALEYLQSLVQTKIQAPQIIFLDIRMPIMDGFDFLVEYDKLPGHIKTDCIIMMLTTSLDPADHERAANNPYVYKFINKPLNRAKIQELEHELIANN